jgi:hypothetical protein
MVKKFKWSSSGINIHSNFKHGRVSIETSTDQRNCNHDDVSGVICTVTLEVSDVNDYPSDSIGCACTLNFKILKDEPLYIAKKHVAAYRDDDHGNDC